MGLIACPSPKWTQFSAPNADRLIHCRLASHGHRLVTEIDGGQNAESKCGAERDRWLASNSYRVLRFWNTNMLQNRERVLQAIINAAREQAPLPNPPPQGRRQRADASGGAQ